VTVYRLAYPDSESGARDSIENGASPTKGTVPILPLTSANFSADQSRYFGPPVPKQEHEAMNLIEPSNPRVETDSELFTTFFAAYPRKVGEKSAAKAFFKSNPTRDLLAQMLKAIAAQAKALDWSPTRLQFVPHPAKWLNDQRWKDEVQYGVEGNQDRYPQWALDAGFENIDEAHNLQCHQHNAHQFSDGKRIQKQIA